MMVLSDVYFLEKRLGVSLIQAFMTKWGHALVPSDSSFYMAQYFH